MAARKNKGTKDQPWSDRTRERIQTSMLINRLTDHVVKGDLMDASQVRAAEILLRKALPDLSSVDMKAELKVDPVAQMLSAVDGKTKDLLDDDTVH